jgi:hypothetical protein
VSGFLQYRSSSSARTSAPEATLGRRGGGGGTSGATPPVLAWRDSTPTAMSCTDSPPHVSVRPGPRFHGVLQALPKCAPWLP